MEVRTFAALDPKYAAWAEAAGLPRLQGAPEDARPFFATGALPHPAARAIQRGRPPEIAAAGGTLRITSPPNDLRLLRDPETPASLATLGLAATAGPAARQLLWSVDGRPISLADYPFSARWPLSPGERTFQVKLPSTDIASAPVRVTVQ